MVPPLTVDLPGPPLPTLLHHLTALTLHQVWLLSAAHSQLLFEILKTETGPGVHQQALKYSFNVQFEAFILEEVK